MLLPLVCPCLQKNMRRNLLCKDIVLQFLQIDCAKPIIFEQFFFVIILAAMVSWKENKQGNPPPKKKSWWFQWHTQRATLTKSALISLFV